MHSRLDTTHGLVATGRSDALARHQHRHRWQAEQVWAALRSSAAGHTTSDR